jgi:ABC-type bacteriocin/lantibiotic exporter with double-glycine peptidase domain
MVSTNNWSVRYPVLGRETSVDWSFARSYHRPLVLILDEATSGLDVVTEPNLLQALRSLAGKLTMVVAAHRLSAMAECDQLIDLRKEPRSSLGGHKVNATMFRC